MSVESLEEAYNRLGVKFDHFDGESMYGGQASDQVRILGTAVISALFAPVLQGDSVS